MKTEAAARQVESGTTQAPEINRRSGSCFTIEHADFASLMTSTGMIRRQQKPTRTEPAIAIIAAVAAGVELDSWTCSASPRYSTNNRPPFISIEENFGLGYDYLRDEVLISLL